MQTDVADDLNPGDRSPSLANAHAEKQMDIKSRLSVLWLLATLNYLYCDVMGLMNPGLLRQFYAGTVNGIPMTQAFLLGAAILVEIPMAMVALSRMLTFRLNRWTNIAAGSVMTAVQLATVILTPPAGYYIFCSIIEITCTALVVWFSLRWRKPDVQAKLAELDVLASRG